MLQVGCGIGDLLAATEPFYGVGIDPSEDVIAFAATRHPKLHFRAGLPETLECRETFDFVILCDAIGEFADVQQVLEQQIPA